MESVAKNSHAIRFATLLVVALLGCLLLARSALDPKNVSPEPARLVAGIPSVTVQVPPDSKTDTAEPPVVDVRRGEEEADRDFVQKAALCAVQEEAVSRGVLNRLVYPEVREYAYKVIEDHRAAEGDLKALVTVKGLTFPEPEPVKYRKWGQGEKSVDRTYVDLMAEENAAIVELFEKATRSSDPDVATFARKALPRVQNHLSMIRDLRRLTD